MKEEGAMRRITRGIPVDVATEGVWAKKPCSYSWLHGIAHERYSSGMLNYLAPFSRQHVAESKQALRP